MRKAAELSFRLLATLLFSFSLLALMPSVSFAQTSPSATGHFLSRTGDNSTVCGGEGTSWTWTYGDQHIVRRMNADGRVLEEWTLPHPIRSAFETPACDGLWVVPEDGRNLVVLRSGSRELTRTDPSTSPDEIRDMVGFPNCAWAKTSKKKMVLGTIEGEVIRWKTIYDRGTHDWATMGCDGIWLAPNDDGTPGVYAVSTDGRKREVLPGEEIESTRPWAQRQLVWANPRGEFGAWLLDRTPRALNGGRRVLADLPVTQISTCAKCSFTWMKAGTGLYGFAWQATPPGSLVPLNKGAPIVDPKTNQVIEPGLLQTGGDGSTAWVTPVERNIGGVPNRIWRLRATGDGAVKVDAIDPELYGRNRISKVFFTSRVPDGVVLLGVDHTLYGIGPFSSIDLHGRKLPLPVDSIYPTLEGSYWLRSSGSSYLLAPASLNGFSGMNVSFGERLLTFPEIEGSAPPALDDTSRATLLFAWRGPTLEADGRINVKVANGNAYMDTSVDVEPVPPERAGAVTKLAPCREGQCLSGVANITLNKLDAKWDEVDVTVTYSNPVGMDVSYSWPKVRVLRPWHERLLASPIVRALLVVLLPLIFVALAFRSSPRLLRWLPPVVPVLELVMAARFPKLAEVSTIDLALTIAAVFAAVIVLALLSPAVFRRISNVQPFRVLVPFALAIPRLRRRVLRAHSQDVETLVADARRRANNEAFFDLGLDVRTMNEPSRNVELKPGPVTVGEIAVLLTASELETRANVLIEAPGGRGKSAVFNRLVEVALERHRNDASAPTPIIADGRKQKLREAIAAGTSRLGLTDDLLDTLLQAGAFIVFIDGLSESNLDPAELSAFLRTELGSRVRICATSRPSEAIRAAFPATEPLRVVEPQALREDNVRAFVAHYQATDAARTKTTPASIDELIRVLHDVARSLADGTYLPLVVRLAVLGSPADATTVADVYEAALEQLLRASKATGGASPDHALARTARLAAETYWPAGERTFAFARPNVEAAALVEQLVTAGVLVRSDTRSSALVKRRPREVRFFHDSIQSYLAASYLAGEAAWEPVLARAAGEPIFASAEADFGRPGGELLQMCLEVFSPRERLRDCLRKTLEQWSTDHLWHLAIVDVVGALPSDVSETALLVAVGPGKDAGEHLRKAIALCKRGKVEEELHLLGALFAGVARRLWPALKDKYAVATVRNAA